MKPGCTEREELMVPVTKEHSSFAYFKGGIRMELSLEFDLMRHKSGRIYELEAGLNAEGFKRKKHMLKPLCMYLLIGKGQC